MKNFIKKFFFFVCMVVSAVPSGAMNYNVLVLTPRQEVRVVWHKVKTNVKKACNRHYLLGLCLGAFGATVGGCMFLAFLHNQFVGQQELADGAAQESVSLVAIQENSRALIVREPQGNLEQSGLSYAELLTALQWEREHNQDLSNQLLPVLRNLDSRGLEPLMRTNQELAANNKNLSQEINTLRHQTGGSAGYTDQRRAPRIRRKFAPRLNTVREERDAALQQENIRLKENVRISEQREREIGQELERVRSDNQRLANQFFNSIRQTQALKRNQKLSRLRQISVSPRKDRNWRNVNMRNPQALEASDNYKKMNLSKGLSKSLSCPDFSKLG